MSDFAAESTACGGDGRRDAFVRDLALIPTIGVLRLTGLLLGLPLEPSTR